MNYKHIPVDLDFYDPDYDNEVDALEQYKCNNCQVEIVDVDGDVCETCYNEE